MLLRFSTQNFMSFKDRTELSMIPSKVRRHQSHVIKPSNRNDIGVLKAAVIYGANASGKSNLIKAMNTARNLIVKLLPASQSLPYTPFLLDPATSEEPIRMEFEIKLGKKNYAYGFSYHSKAITEEWLYEINKIKEKMIFERSLKSEESSEYTLEYDLKFDNDKDKQFFEFTASGTPKNRLFINECNERNVYKKLPVIEDLLTVREWFEGGLKIIFPDSKYGGLERDLDNNNDLGDIFTEVLKSFDTGIKSLSMNEVNVDSGITGIPRTVLDKLIEQLDNEDVDELIFATPGNQRYKLCNEDGHVKAYRLMTTHQSQGNDDVKFELNQESDGTLRILDLTPGLLEVCKSETTYVIDELDRSLHPDITTSIISSFLNNTPEIRSQLIVTTHETTLLNQAFLRKDEIWFTDKNKYGISKLYSLEEYQPRFDKDIRKSYLTGRFGGIPCIPQKNNLEWMKNA